MSIIEIGTSSVSTTAFFLPSPPMNLVREELIVKKRSVQGDLNVTQTGKNQKVFEFSWEVARKNGSTSAGTENYDSLVAFCNQSSQFFVKIRNRDNNQVLFSGFAYLEMSSETIRSNALIYSFTLTVSEI